MGFKERTYEVLGPPRRGDALQRAVMLAIVALIVLNVAALMLETVASIHDRYDAWFWRFEILSVVVFSLEYVLRMWSCTTAAEYAHPVKGRLRLAGTPLMVVDALAVLPFYLFFLPIDLRALRALRVMRIFRLFKLARYNEAMTSIGRVFTARAAEILVSLMIASILLVVAASLMYEAEHEAQPDKFSSIPATLWWAIITITTIGYGDIVPITAQGKVLGGLIAVAGVMFVAVPIAIVSAGLMEELQKLRQKKEAAAARPTCPHCGKDLTR